MTPSDTPAVTLKLAETEIVTVDPVVVQTVWRLLGTSVSHAERQALDGRSFDLEPVTV